MNTPPSLSSPKILKRIDNRLVLESPLDLFLSTNSLKTIEKVAILATLKYLSGHRRKTAESLGISIRTLGMKLKQYNEEGNATS